jgi:hypothetical protein
VLAAVNPAQKELALNALVPAITAAFLVSGIAAGTPVAEAQSDRASWPEVIAAAIRSDDDHVIKLVHASAALAPLHGSPWALRAAQRATQTLA